MNTDKVLALAREAGLAVTISSHDSLHKFDALIQRQMIEDGWRPCAEGQGTTQYCGIAEELRKDAFSAGYETAHNHTVEGSYAPELSLEDYLAEIKERK